jgi:hypothetical protein
MAAASAYLLHVPEARREIILDRAEKNRYFPGATAAEPVEKFPHGRNAALIVLASFRDGALTHIANGRKGASAGTGLARLNMTDFQRLERPLPFVELVGLVPPKFRAPLRRVLDGGGLLPPKTLGAVVDALTQRDPNLVSRLARFSERRAQTIRNLEPAERANLAIQKESLGLALALDIAGMPRAEILSWSPTPGKPASFLEGLPGARVREDVMIIKDFTSLPGFEAVRDATNVAAMTFENPSDRSQKLTVIMANRLPLEEQTGADLIYYNETYRAFVLVQYKAMEKAEERVAFRWQDGDRFSNEIERMDVMLAELAKCAVDDAPEGFRLCSNPFFLKFCSRVVFNPDDTGLFSGIYLPLDLWKSLHAGGRLKGPQGGNVLSFENVGRKLSNSEFIELVANSWVGTTIPQSAELAKVIRAVLESGRTVTFAMKHLPASDDADGAGPTAPLDFPSLRFDDDRTPADEWFDLEEVVEPQPSPSPRTDYDHELPGRPTVGASQNK